jgi:hypothetical protein
MSKGTSGTGGKSGTGGGGGEGTSYIKDGVFKGEHLTVKFPDSHGGVETGLFYKHIDSRLKELGMSGKITLIHDKNSIYGVKKVKGERMTFKADMPTHIYYKPGEYDSPSNRFDFEKVGNNILLSKESKWRKMGYSKSYLFGRDEAMGEFLGWYLKSPKGTRTKEQPFLQEILGRNKNY